MPTSSRELLALARKLQANETSEAALRCAVSRAHYAALHHVAAVFEPRTPSDQRKSESSHEEIIARAEVYGKGANLGRLCALDIAKMWPKFKRLRVKADYDLYQHLSIQECADSITRCEMVMSLCDEVVQKRADKAAN